MGTLKARIKAVEKKISQLQDGLFTVYYKDGTTKRVPPGETINLCLQEGEKIERFEEDPGSKGKTGILEGLVNELLSIEPEEAEKAFQDAPDEEKEG